MKHILFQIFHSIDEEASLMTNEKNNGMHSEIKSPSKGKNHLNLLKQVVFSIVWLISAWHLLTVKEKIPHRFDISLDSHHTKSKFV